MSIKKYLENNKALSTFLTVVVLVIVAVIIMFATRSNPIAMVGSSFITSGQLQEQYSLAKKFDSNATRSQAFNQLVINNKKHQLAGNVDLNKELQFYKTDRGEEYRNFIDDYFSSNEKLFVKYVVAPKAYDAALAIKYNSNFGNNNDAYNKASNILSRLENGENFDELAKTYSDDKISGQLGGDLGFVGSGQILPELEKALTPTTVGEVKKQIIVSRLGYHILYPVELADKDGQKVLHLKHILITTTGYDSWLDGQLGKIGVRRLGGI